MRLKTTRLLPWAALSLLVIPQMIASSHREAPITALDQKADITDWYAFVDPGHPDRVVMILNVDPFLEPSNGPNYFPFDPGILYEMKVDNNQDGIPDVTFQFRFKTEIRAPGVFTGLVGGIAGIPPITALDGKGSEGFNLRQTYTVTMVTKNGTQDLTAGQTLFAVPSNVGPRTMPDYNALRAQGSYSLDNSVQVFAGTVADPFFIDLGAAFDSLNFRAQSGGGVLSNPRIEFSDDQFNYAPNALSGFNVNTMVVEVPISMLTSDGKMHAATDKAAVIGTYGATSRQNTIVLRDPTGTFNPSGSGSFVQVQRLGNPLINELIIGTGSKDKFSTDVPINDSQFAGFVLDPLLAKIFASLGIPVAPAPRTDLLPLVQYQAPICPGCAASDAGPIADLLRLNTGIPPTPFANAKRMGFLAGDNAGFPNGRRLNDDVVDIAARVVAGILVDPVKFGTPIGDGVNVPSAPISPTFPFEAPAYSGRNSMHNGPGQPGCNFSDGDCPN
jgi:hypothetical protein